ncbi:MAG TPA: helix-hairpin-helix domain-containing protein [Gemmatimonadaceae bacterium]|nr:helix-hairpin-helix domain-containing protein [Gemmatimonadaceae bacterium]
MPTPAERRAILFLGAVALLGSGVRAWRLTDSPPLPSGESLLALDAQIAAADSARVHDSTRRAARKQKRKGSGRHPLGGGAPRERASSGRRSAPAPMAAPPGALVSPATPGSDGAEPVFGDPRDAGGAAARARAVRRSRLARPSEQPPKVGPPLDVDRATPAELERLPGVGPALAARIVADRDARGAFGSADALARVAGIGPALARRLAPLVTFSGTPRPSSAAPGEGTNPRRGQHIRRAGRPP